MAKRITQTIQREIVDVTTGEVVKVDTQKTFTEKVSPESFYMTFIGYMSPLFNLHSDVARSILDWMCMRAEYNSGVVDLSASKRQKMCQDLSITSNQVTNNLRKLKELGLITGDKGEFTINPEIFWKGDTKTRQQVLEGKSLKVSFEIVDNQEE
jgi:hypothetical protein